ncbi:MAG: ATP-dependent DNA ligase [Candidatus Thorarchaeota archaeon]
MTEFLTIAEALERISETSKRNEKISIIAEVLNSVGSEEIRFAAMALAGRVFAENDERTLNISWSGMINALRKVIDYDEKDFGEFYQGDVGDAIANMFSSGKYSRQQSLFAVPITIGSLESDLEKISSFSGKGSKNEREAVIARILMDASLGEIKPIVALVLGDTRTGASDAIVIEGIAKAFGIDSELVRRAWNFCGDIGKVAETAATRGEDGVKEIGVLLFVPVKPMLATPAGKVGEILDPDNNSYVIEYKYDGARVQIHKKGETIRIFSRRLNDVTESMPEIVQIVQEKVTSQSAILDGEVIAVDERGNPFPFQVVMRRFGRSRDVEETSKKVKLKLILFDVLLVDGKTVVDHKLVDRRAVLETIAADTIVTFHKDVANQETAENLFQDSKVLGHEGIMLKGKDSAYIPGKRGRNWFKVKHTLDTLDLVVIAAEWGHGRRKDWLSDYHLGVWDADSGEFTSVGKTYKGLTDVELGEMTKRLQEISISSTRGLVTVRPEIVVEIIADEIQESPTYKSGFALRFARISRIRDDIGPSDCTTLEELGSIFESQFKFKAR